VDLFTHNTTANEL